MPTAPCRGARGALETATTLPNIERAPRASKSKGGAMEIVAGAYPGKCLFVKKFPRKLTPVRPEMWAAGQRKLSNSRRADTQSRWWRSADTRTGVGQQFPAPRAPVMCAQPSLRVPAIVGTLILRAGAARAVLRRARHPAAPMAGPVACPPWRNLNPDEGGCQAALRRRRERSRPAKRNIP